VTRAPLEDLEWDSAFFGFPIARADIAGAGAERFEAIEEEAGRRGVVCAYATLDPTETATSALAQRFGYRLVEVGITFRHPDGRFSPRPGPSVARRGTIDDLALLEDAIATVGDWSRFGADPRFGPPAARRMSRAWIERAADSGDERMLSITEDDRGVTGFATHVRGRPDRMDLVSVTKPGTGAVDALYTFFHDWARTDEVEAGDAAARNVAIIRFLERCGYRMVRSQYQFHRWFDEG
jgi:dTDP-4-amino-4,6-dideoxy-D-galactose acyltransferase